MRTLYKNAKTVDGVRDIAVEDGIIVEPEGEFDTVRNLAGLTLLPGLCDAHVHLREPGFVHKENIRSGTLAAAYGGFTAVCAMPNLDPVPDSAGHILKEIKAIREKAVVDVLPYGSITVGEKGLRLSDMPAMEKYVCGYSDDGVGLNDPALLAAAGLYAKEKGKVIAAHCEDLELRAGGVVNDCAFARERSLPGISNASEYRAVRNSIEAMAEAGCADTLHICHVSCAESADFIRRARKRGLAVTAETTPNYLWFCDEDLEDDGRFKMNPPLRSREDRAALIDAVADGTIGVIATDHAPHTAAEKSGGLMNAAMGVVGLDIAFAAMYTGFVKTEILTLSDLVRLMSTSPRARFGAAPVSFEPGSRADFCVFNTKARFTVDPSNFKSWGRSTPFAGKRLSGRHVLTVLGDKVFE
ncbi:MAG: dihydroorotase [Clostridia bacterium]|nr:dihydroorotase [Clostridia bacterium]